MLLKTNAKKFLLFINTIILSTILYSVITLISELLKLKTTFNKNKIINLTIYFSLIFSFYLYNTYSKICRLLLHKSRYLKNCAFPHFIIFL